MGRKKGKGLVKEQVRRTHACGLGLVCGGWVEESKGGKLGTTVKNNKKGI